MRKRSPARLNAGGLWEYAVRILSGRACSSAELRQKLRSRAERLEDADEVIARLKDRNYLDDRKFAESFAASRLENQRFGKTRVLSDLRQRRVAPALAERSVRKVYENVEEEALVEDFVRRKYRLASRDNLFQDEKEMASAYRRLLRAGFSSGTVVRVLKRFSRNPELLDGFEPPEEPLEEDA